MCLHLTLAVLCMINSHVFSQGCVRSPAQGWQSVLQALQAFCDLKQGPMLSRADTALRAAHLSPSARRLLPSLLLCGAEEPLDADGVAEVVLGRELLGLELLPVVGSAHLRMRASTTGQRSRIVCGAPRGAGVRATSMRRAVRLRLRLRAGTIRRQPTAAAMLHGARRADHPSTLICSLAMPPMQG